MESKSSFAYSHIRHSHIRNTFAPYLKPTMNFTQQLLSWYSVNKRDLPWRRTKDPYLVWLSEIIMQQTRIEQGTPYYERFATAYPTVEQLAEADQQEVLKLWQGLGYYSRARNLHATARVISAEHGGVFPGNYADIRRLKGIGDYTAAAVASICFDLPHAVMDGNVMRFISRLFGIAESIDLPATKRKIHFIATQNIDHRNPGDYNQALMEFGATFCTPAKPDCIRCIFRDTCVAFNKSVVEAIPVRSSKTAIRQRFIHYLVLTFTIHGRGYICMNKRTGNDIWKNLYDFPSLELPPGIIADLPASLGFMAHGSDEFEFLGVSEEYVHALTHQKLHARFYRYHATKNIELPYLLVPPEDIHQYPVPRLIDRYLSQHILCGDQRT